MKQPQQLPKESVVGMLTHGGLHWPDRFRLGASLEGLRPGFEHGLSVARSGSFPKQLLSACFCALGHWLFGTDHPTNADLVGAQVLTPISTHPPALSSNYLTTENSDNNGGLKTPFTDSTDQ